MHRSIPLATAFAIYMGAAHADTFTDAIVTNLQDLGYDFIEIQNGINQVKVEAVRGSEKLEVVYDKSTGKILKQERESAGEDAGRSGVQVRNRSRNFLDDDDIDGRDDEDDDEDDDDEDDDDESGRSYGDDEDDDDDDSDEDDESDDDDDDDDDEGSGSSRSGSGGGSDDDEDDDED